MTDVHDDDKNAEVDFVFTWIDGSDPEHQTLRQQYLSAKQRLHASSYEPCRWRSSGEINESIQSVLTFAPWVRNIYVVCSLGQKPDLSFDVNQYIHEGSSLCVVTQEFVRIRADDVYVIRLAVLV